MLPQGQWKFRALEILDAGIAYIRSASKVVVDSGGEIDASAATGSIRLAAGEIATADLDAGAVTFAKAKVFISAEQTGNGLEQSVAHGLEVTPAGVLIVPTDTAPAITGAYTAVEGAHTTTDVVVTVTTDKKYKVFAWA